MDLRNYYDRNYHRRIHKAFLEDESYYQARAQAFRQLYFTPEEAENACVLDYGCGLGQAISALRNGEGYDASAEARDSARARGLRIYETPEEIPQGAYDVVICRHALEHVPDPYATLVRLRSYLKSGGKLILVLPKENHYYCSFKPDINMHLFCWNYRTINNLLAVAGMEANYNRDFYMFGFRKLLPIRRAFGEYFYLQSTFIVGRLYRVGELVIHASAVAHPVFTA